MYDPEMEKNHQNHWEKNLNTDWIYKMLTKK